MLGVSVTAWAVSLFGPVMRPVPNRIEVVFGGGVVSKILDAVVRRVAVVMAHVEPCRAWPNEQSGHELVDPPPLALSVDDQGEVSVSMRVRRLRQDPACQRSSCSVEPRHGTNASEVRYSVRFGCAREGTPFLTGERWWYACSGHRGSPHALLLVVIRAKALIADLLATSAYRAASDARNLRGDREGVRIAVRFPSLPMQRAVPASVVLA